MVRSVAERALVPTRHLLEEFGDMMILTGKTIWSALTPPYIYGGELVSQFLFALRLGLALVLSAGIGAKRAISGPWCRGGCDFSRAAGSAYAPWPSSA